MTRAAEHPPKTSGDHDYDADQDALWEHLDGEVPDIETRQTLNLAHRVADKFPELANRYRSFAGPAAVVSSVLVALAGVAIARRAKRGQQPDEILDEITSEEIVRAAGVTSRYNRLWRTVLRIARRRSEESPEESTEDEEPTEDAEEDKE